MGRSPSTGDSETKMMSTWFLRPHLALFDAVDFLGTIFLSTLSPKLLAGCLEAGPPDTCAFHYTIYYMNQSLSILVDTYPVSIDCDDQTTPSKLGYMVLTSLRTIIMTTTSSIGCFTDDDDTLDCSALLREKSGHRNIQPDF